MPSWHEALGAILIQSLLTALPLHILERTLYVIIVLVPIVALLPSVC